MATKIRLQRHGKKGKPFYWIVAADSRAKRDGRFIEKLGTYNPITNPAQIELNVDAAVKWLHNGAQPTETAKRILSYKGALLKHHLEIGVRKGALSAEDVEKKLNAWLDEKAVKIGSKIENLKKDREAKKSQKIKSEKDFRETKAPAAPQEPAASNEESVITTKESAETPDEKKPETEA